MKLTLFEMSRMQSAWENVVHYDLSDSGVYPMKLSELLELGRREEEFLSFRLGYSQSNGTPELRRLIAQGYSGASENEILVTNGSSEANFVSLWHILERGDEMALLLPNYMQIWGLGKTGGLKIRPFHLQEGTDEWVVDEEELKEAVTKRTKLLAVCNPNNPTGAVLERSFLRLVVDLASEVGAWILSDEVYQGSEREGPQAPSLWGMYEKALVVNGLSKAYGLAGLRIGWVAGPKRTIADIWPHLDYTTICPSYLGDRLAQIALEPANRRKILERGKGILRNNYVVLESWVREHADVFHLIPPRAGAMAFMSYKPGVKSEDLAEYLIHKKDTLIVPGDHFGMDRYVRICYGHEEQYLRSGLDLMLEGLEELSHKAAEKRGT